MKLIVASSNKGKLREIKKIFDISNIEILSMKDIGIDIEIEENGSTFEENALIKARAVSKLCQYPVLSDDSGLCVDALGGAPGIYSARYAGEGASDEDRILKLLDELKNEENRNAKFVCAVALVMPNGNEYISRGEVLGKIGYEICGLGGFGYDPVFISDELKKTFAEATPDEKNSISHRYRALTQLYNDTKEILERGN